MSKRQGIVHVIGPENGATLPGMTVVCGDSHTSTHGAFGALAHGIGTSRSRARHWRRRRCCARSEDVPVRVEGASRQGVHREGPDARIIGRIGTAGGTGHTIELPRSAIARLAWKAA